MKKLKIYFYAYLINLVFYTKSDNNKFDKKHINIYLNIFFNLNI